MEEKILLLDGGRLSLRLCTLRLKAAEERDDMEHYRDLLREPHQDFSIGVLIVLPNESDFAYLGSSEISILNLPEDIAPDISELRKQHYRDLEYPGSRRNAQLQRSKRHRY